MDNEQLHGIEPDQDVDELARSLADMVSVNVVMGRYESDSPWQDYRWELVGITTNVQHTRDAAAVTADALRNHTIALPPARSTRRPWRS